MNKLWDTLIAYDLRVISLEEEGFTRRNAERIAEKELYNKFWMNRKKANV